MPDNRPRLLIAVVLLLCPLRGTAQDQTPVRSPVPAKDTVKNFVVHPEFSIELAACEPTVVDPVAIKFDEHGNMWVVEMRDYPHGPARGEKPASRIRVLRDTDGDGFFETAHTFAENLLFATGLQPWNQPNPGTANRPHHGVIVTTAGRVQWMCDTNGDYRADVVETWYEGFMQENPQLRANDPTVGPDGWIYVANGLRNGVVKAVRQGWTHHKPVTLRSQDFRFHPTTGQCEAISGYGQFGMTFDDAGNRFVCSNRNPNNHVVLPQRYLNRNPYLVRTDSVEVVSPAGPDSRVYAISKPWTTSTLHAGQFTAACGVTIYRGDAFPKPFYQNSFTCEPTGNLVHRDVLTPSGPTFTSRPGREGVEFLASRDNWFRPVNLSNGPDGNLYVVDMYRAVIEHPQFMPAELKVRTDLRDGEDRGRIYRIVPLRNQHRESALPRRSEERSVATALASPNGWHRDTATRIVYEQGRRPLEVDGQRTVFRELLVLGDKSDDPATAARAASLAAGSPHPRHDQALLTFPPSAGLPLLRELVRYDSTDAVIAALARQIALANRDGEAAIAATVLMDLPTARRHSAAEGLALGLLRKGQRLGVLADQLPAPARERLEAVFVAAAERLRSGTTSQRLAAIRLLRHAKPQAASTAFRAALGSPNNADVEAAVIEALAPFQSAEIATELLANFNNQTPRIQRAIVVSCRARPDSALVLVRSVLDSRTPSSAIDSATQKVLRRYTQPELKSVTNRVLAALIPEDRKAVLTEYADSVKLDSNPNRGRVVFEKNCATCHRIGSIGVDIAPDIADSRTRTPEYLLTNILDPNRAVDANYFSYTAVTEDGRVVTGIIASETEASVTLKQAEGKTVTLLRDDIEELKSDGVSLMPVGVEKNINKQQMADLISFIKNWRYLDGDIPIDVGAKP